MAQRPKRQKHLTTPGLKYGPSHPAIAALVHPSRPHIYQTFDLAAAMQGQTKIEELKHFDLPLKPLAKF